MSHYNCPAYGSLRTYPAYQQPRCWSIIECPSGNHLFAINSYDTLKLKTFDNRISISGNACEKTITFDLNTDVSFNNIDVDGDALITGKLTVGGLIDPTGLVLEHQAAAPHTNTGTQGTLWVNGNDLKFTDSTAATITLGAGGGGGGGGGVDSKWKERTFASSKWLEPSGTDISGIICGNVLIEEFLLVEKKFLAGGPMESPLLLVLPVSEGTPNGHVEVAGPLVVDGLVDVSGNFSIANGIIDYSVGSDQIATAEPDVYEIIPNATIIQVSGPSPKNVDISIAGVLDGQILIILVPIQNELNFLYATNVVLPSGKTLAKANTAVHFVYKGSKWWSTGLVA